MSADYPSMTTAEIRSKFLNFFEERGLKLYPSSSPTILRCCLPTQA